MANCLSWILPLFFLMKHTNCGSSAIVEKGQSANIMCAFPTSVSGVTWDVVGNNTSVMLSHCTNTTCINAMPLLYQGDVTTSDSGNEFRLNVTKARTNETEFVCVANNGDKLNVSLEVYAWPNDVRIVHDSTYTHADYTCTVPNVYPDAAVVLHRRQGSFNLTDFDYNHTECVRGNYGSGNLGDYTVVCKWRVPVQNMLLKSNVACQAVALISNKSATTRKAIRSDYKDTEYTLPTIRLKTFDSSSACPAGPGVYTDSILIGTSAVCWCELQTPGWPPGSVDWYNKEGTVVGHVINNGSMASVTFSYSDSDPNQSYECRSITILRGKNQIIKYTPKFRTGNVFAEKYTKLDIACRVPNDARSITWQYHDERGTVNLSSCSFVTNKCTDTLPILYLAFITETVTDKSAGLRIVSVNTGETQFSCLTNTRLNSNITQLEVYGRPKNPSCKYEVMATYIKYRCRTGEVYPHANATLHRRGRDFKSGDKDVRLHRCMTIIIIHFSTTASCKWEVLINPTIHEIIVYAEMYPRLTNATEMKRIAVFSPDVVTTLRKAWRYDASSREQKRRTDNFLNSCFISFPEVVLNKENCPVGPMVQSGSITIGTNATCKCELKFEGIPPGFARWFTQNYTAVGNESKEDGSSTLDIVYNYLDPNETYECWPQTILEGNITYVTYTPTFNSATHNNLAGLPALVTLLLTVLSWIVSPCDRM